MYKSKITSENAPSCIFIKLDIMTNLTIFSKFN